MGGFVHPCRADQAWWIGSWPFLVWQTERQLLMYGKNKSGRGWPTATTAPLFVFYGSVRPTLSLNFFAVHSPFSLPCFRENSDAEATVYFAIVRAETRSFPDRSAARVAAEIAPE